MAMDMLRSCYSTTMRFFPDSDLEIPVRWFFCDDNAKDFPAWTRFASGNWAPERSDWIGPGEVLDSPRPWADGSPPPFDGTVAPGFTGQTFVGSLEAFGDGVPYPATSAGGRNDGSCSVCAGGLPAALCALMAPWANSDLVLTIVRVDNPLSPPVGTVGQSFRAANQGPMSWASMILPIYPPTGFGAFIEFHCLGTPPAEIFNGQAFLPWPPPGPVVDIPWEVVSVDPLLPLDLQATTTQVPFYQAGAMGTEKWTLKLTSG
jgi:hypothetical protein